MLKGFQGKSYDLKPVSTDGSSREAFCMKCAQQVPGLDTFSYVNKQCKKLAFKYTYLDTFKSFFFFFTTTKNLKCKKSYTSAVLITLPLNLI